MGCRSVSRDSPHGPTLLRVIRYDVVHEVTQVGQAGQLALAEGGGRLLQLHPGAARGPSVQLLPDHLPAHPEVGIELLVDVMVVAGYPLVADLGELPVLVQPRVVDQDMAAAQQVAQPARNSAGQNPRHPRPQ
jgi:hypothetical protein